MNPANIDGRKPKILQDKPPEIYSETKGILFYTSKATNFKVFTQTNLQSLFQWDQDQVLQCPPFPQPVKVKDTPAPLVTVPCTSAANTTPDSSTSVLQECSTTTKWDSATGHILSGALSANLKVIIVVIILFSFSH